MLCVATTVNTKIWLDYSLLHTSKDHVVKSKFESQNYRYLCYVTLSKLCDMQFVGQSKNPFSFKFSSHCQIWNSFNTLKTKNDQTFLFRHYASHHADVTTAKLVFWFCFLVIYVLKSRGLKSVVWCIKFLAGIAMLCM